MADTVFKFQLSKEGERVYDWPEIVGGSEEAQDAFSAMPYDRKVQMFDDWETLVKETAQAEGIEDFTKFDNFATNTRGYLAEQYGDTDTLGEEITSAVGKTYEGVADRADFLSSPDVQANILNAGNKVAMAPIAPLFAPGSPFQLPQVNPDTLAQNPLSSVGSAFADRARTLGENLQGGTVERSGIFQPQNPRWWAEKALPTLGGLLTDLGIAASTGPAAPYAFAISAASQVGGQTLNESKAGYQKQAQDKYTARLNAGMAVAEARTLLRGEMAKGEESAATEATLVAAASSIINAIPGSTLTRTGPIYAVVKKVLAKSKLPSVVTKAGSSMFGEALSEVFDEIAQDAGRLGRQVGDFPERWQKYKDSKPGERYATAGFLGGVMGGSVDAAIQGGEFLASRKIAENVAERTSGVDPVQQVVEETTAQNAPEAPVEPSITGEFSMDVPGGETPTITEEVNTPEAEAEPVSNPSSLKRGDTVSWINRDGSVTSGAVTSKKGGDIWVDGKKASYPPGQLFKGVVQTKNNAANLEVGDVLLMGDGTAYRNIGNGDFHPGGKSKGEVSFDTFDLASLGRNLIDDPRAELYDGEAFKQAVDEFNDRPDPQDSDSIRPLLDRIGEKQGPVVTTESVPEAQEEVAPATKPQYRERTKSLVQLRNELTRRARLDTKRNGASKILPQQVDALVEVIDASASAIASRTGRNADEILSRITFGHELARGEQGNVTGVYDRLKRQLNLFSGSRPDTLVHEWGHFVLEEHIYNRDETLNILNPDEREVLEKYIRSKTGRRVSRNGRPTDEAHEYFSEMLEKMFQQRYYEGNKPANIPENVWKVLSKVGDFIRQTWSQFRSGVNRSDDLNELSKNQEIISYMDRIFIPDQVENMVNDGVPVPDVLLGKNDPAEEPDIGRIAENLKAAQTSNTRPKILNSIYETLDRLQAEGRLGQPSVEEESTVKLRQPMGAMREFDRMLDDGIDSYATLALNSRYEVKSREVTLEKAKNVLERMTTGEAMAYLMGDGYGRNVQARGDLEPEVYVASLMIMATRTRQDQTLLNQAVAEERITPNQALELHGLYESFLTYTWEVASPAAGRAIDIFNYFREPFTARAKMDRLLGLVSATNSAMVKRAMAEMGGEKFAWMRTKAEQARAGGITPETYARRVREFKAEFIQAFPPTERGYAKGYINRVGGLYQTLLENPGAALPDVAQRTFGNTYWFSPQLETRLAGIMQDAALVPGGGIAQNILYSEAMALLATEAGIPLGQTLSQHYVAQYLAGPSTQGVSLVGNLLLVGSLLGQSLLGASRTGNRGEFNTGTGGLIINGWSPNIQYVPSMLASVARTYGVRRSNNPQSRKAWEAVRVAAMGYGSGTRVHEGRLNFAEIGRMAARYRTPQGVVDNLLHISQAMYRLFQALPLRGLSASDAAVGTGASEVTATTAASHVADTNARRYRNNLAANPGNIPAHFLAGRSTQAEAIERATRAFRDAEYLRLMGHSAPQIAWAVDQARIQAEIIRTSQSLQGSKSGANANLLEWVFLQEAVEQNRQQAFGDEANVDEEAIIQRFQQNNNGATPTADELQEAIAQESEERQTGYQQEQRLMRELASFSYRPGGSSRTMANVLNAVGDSLTLRVGRADIPLLAPVRPHFNQNGEPDGVTGGWNVGEIRPLSWIFSLFSNSISLGYFLAFQMTPWGMVRVARGGPVTGGERWNAAERNAFTGMSIIGSMLIAALFVKHADDEDPFEKDKEHVIGPFPRNLGKRLRAAGIEPYTRYTLDSKTGKIKKHKLNSIQGFTTTPYIPVAAYNSWKWSRGEDGAPLSPPQALQDAILTGIQTAVSLGPLNQLSSLTNDKDIGATYSALMEQIKQMPADGILLGRRALNEMSTMITEAGRAAGVPWETDLQKEPSYQNGQEYMNMYRFLANDYLIFSNSASRPKLNGNGETMPETGDNMFRKYADVENATPIQKLLIPYSLSLQPIQRYQTNIRKGDDEDMQEFFAEAKQERAKRLPQHLVGVLTNEERWEFAHDYYAPLLKKELGQVLKGDPYKTEGVQSLVTTALEDPDNNSVPKSQLEKEALQEYVNSLRSKVEGLALAQYLADKSPSLDSEVVKDALEDMQWAIEGDMEFSDE